MDILFIHGNYPAQFRKLAELFGKQATHRVKFLTAREDPEQHPLPGVEPIQFTDAQKECDPNSHFNLLSGFVTRGLLIQQEVLKLLENGFSPKLVFFHGGNGLGMYLRQALPHAKLIGYFEWYFSNQCAKLILGKDDIKTLNFISSRNIPTENEIISSDLAIVPTEWQKSQFPNALHDKLTTIFDGIDTQFFCPPNPNFFSQSIEIIGEDHTLTINKDDLILSYATRGMEPLRGFPEFMHSLPPLLKKLPNLKVIVGGRDRSAYGPCAPSHNGSWKDRVLEELKDFEGKERIFYTGLMNYDNYRKLLWRTNLHCYLTMPYVTSWSFFEALACGTPVITNKTGATQISQSTDKQILYLEKMEDINDTSLVPIISNLLNNKNKDRTSRLPHELNNQECIIAWESSINVALQNAST